MSDKPLTRAKYKKFIIHRLGQMKKALEENPTAFVKFCGGNLGRPTINPENMIMYLEKRYQFKNMKSLNFSSMKYIKDNAHSIAGTTVEMVLV